MNEGLAVVMKLSRVSIYNFNSRHVHISHRVCTTKQNFHDWLGVSGKVSLLERATYFHCYGCELLSDTIDTTARAASLRKRPYVRSAHAALGRMIFNNVWRQIRASRDDTAEIQT